MYKWTARHVGPWMNKLSIKDLNKFKKHPRVDEGVSVSERTYDPRGALELGAKLARSKHHWIVFFGRSRLYAVKAKHDIEVIRIIKQFIPTVGRFRINRVR